jgi:hypothetical protein
MTQSKHFETEYFKTIAKINAFLKNSQVSTSQQAQGASNNVHFPQLKLPTFSGAYTQWLSF